MTATTSSRSLLWARVFILLFGASLLVTYAQLVKFIPDGITGGMLDGARNIAQGRGLVTNSINPAFLPYYKDLTLPLPYLWYPLVPFVTAGFFVVLGSHPWCLLIFPVAACFLSALLLLELGRRLFGIGTGLLAAVLLLAHPFMIETSMRENFTDPVLIFLLIACVLAVFIAGSDEARRPMAWLVLAGVTLGLAQYARSAATTLYVPMAFLIVSSFDEKRGARLAVFLGSCLAIQVPMFLWNLKHVGTLTFTPAYMFLFLTRSFPSLSAFSYLLPTRVQEVTRLYGRDILEKWLSQVWVHYKYFFTMANPMVLVGAALTMTSTLTRPSAC